jgi:hypothetical protein
MISTLAINKTLCSLPITRYHITLQHIVRFSYVQQRLWHNHHKYTCCFKILCSVKLIKKNIESLGMQHLGPNNFVIISNSYGLLPFLIFSTFEFLRRNYQIMLEKKIIDNLSLYRYKHNIKITYAHSNVP